MADAAVPQQQYATPAAVPQGAKEQYIQQTPVWVVVVRGVQVFFGFVILVMAGYLIHGSAQGAYGFAVVCVRPLLASLIEPRAYKFLRACSPGLWSRTCLSRKRWRLPAGHITFGRCWPSTSSWPSSGWLPSVPMPLSAPPSTLASRSRAATTTAAPSARTTAPSPSVRLLPTRRVSP